MILLDKLDTPRPISTLSDLKAVSDGFWNYNLKHLDYFCSPITVGVEMQSSSLTLEIGGNMIHLPVDWHVIVCDKATCTMDVIKVHELTNSNFKLFVVGPTHHTVMDSGYRIVNFDQARTFFYPSLTKHQVMCIAISPTKWILISPIDFWQKFLKNMCPADLIM
jgi:hypothetical protein